MSNYCEVQKIIGSFNGNDDSTYYHVEWVPTWEPEHSFDSCKHFIFQFKGKKCNKTKKKWVCNSIKSVLLINGNENCRSYAVERIINVHVREDGTYYKVQWKPTWERDANLLRCDGLIKEFIKERNTCDVIKQENIGTVGERVDVAENIGADVNTNKNEVNYREMSSASDSIKNESPGDKDAEADLVNIDGEDNMIGKGTCQDGIGDENVPANGSMVSDSCRDSKSVTNSADDINERIPLRKLVSENIDNCLSKCTKIPCSKDLPENTSNKNTYTKNQEYSKKYKCAQCLRSFSQRCHLANHVKTHYGGQKILECKICHRMFPHKSALNRHQPLHWERKPFNCEQCGKGYTRNSHLKRHIRSHDEHKPFKCDQCDWRFGDKSDLKVHQRRHTGEKPYACDKCDLQFTASSNLAKHLRIHTGQKPHSCKTCGKGFLYKNSLLRHTVIHTESKPYACHICGKTFMFEDYLQNHVKRHSGEKNYCCDICGQTFTTKYALTKLHMRIHTGDKPYKCEQCGKRFRIDPNYKRHLKIHLVIKPHKCEVCDKRFAEKAQLKHHCKAHGLTL